MIKITYGGTDSNADCERIFPLQDSIGLLNLVKQDILKNDVPYEVVGNSAHTFYCVGNFYVFSKLKIVYGGKSQRISYRAFIVALEKYETDYNVLEEIDKLENQYTAGEPIQQNTLPDGIKSESSTSKNKTIAVYYSSEEELKKYFIINDNYKQYNSIYFINKNCNGKSDPINALKNYDVVIEINKLISVPEKVQEDTEKSKKQTLKQLVKDEWLELLVAFLIGGLLFGSIFNQINKQVTITKYEQYEIPETDTIVHKQDFHKYYKDTVIIKDPPIAETKEVETDKPKAKEQSNKSEKVSQPGNKQKEQPHEDLVKFLQSDCKKLTLDQINEKINSFPDWRNTKNLLGFANFLELMKKNPPNKQDITNFIDENKSNFNEEDEYVKFVRYMSKKEEAFFDSKTKNIRSIFKQTLKEIETKYDYNE